MKKRWQIFVYLLLYLLILSLALGFDIRGLISFRELGVFLLGTMLLALPFCSFERNRAWIGRFLLVCGKRAVDAGVLQTFLLLFVRMSRQQSYAGLPAEIALCFRPMLYAFCMKLILERDEQMRTEKAEEGCDGEFRESPALVREITYEDCMQAGLTRRESEIALLVCRGCSNGEIAEELVISQATVKKHMSNIFEKTGITKREELQEFIKEQI